MANPRIVRVDAPGELLVFLLTAFPDLNRTRLKQYLKHRCVTVNGTVATRHDHTLAPGDKVGLDHGSKPRARASLPAGMKVLYEDDAFLVIHKPPGMLSVPTRDNPIGTALSAVNEYLSSVPGAGRRRVHVVHRLDKHTSGLLLFAKTARARAFFLANWKRVEKRYLAIVEGKVRPESGVMRSVLTEDKDMRVRSIEPDEEGEVAVTRYRVLKSDGRHSLVECVLETGRKNQIRVQLADLGHPILGDKKYGSPKNPCGRLALHAWRMKVPHPETGKPIYMESDYPAALQRVLPFKG